MASVNHVESHDQEKHSVSTMETGRKETKEAEGYEMSAPPASNSSMTSSSNNAGLDSSPNFIRTGDGIALAILTDPGRIEKHYLSAGFGPHYCTVLQEPAQDQEPPIIWRHTFQIYDADSVHAIDSWNKKERRKDEQLVVHYGQAVLLKSAERYLCCLPYNSSKVGGKYKMSDNHSNYLVGLSPFNERVKVDDYCWFVLLPASRDRNIGEKIKAGDEINLVNLGTKRYMSLPWETADPDESSSQHNTSFSVDFEDDSVSEIIVASFSPCSWMIDIVLSSPSTELFNSYLKGGDPIQLRLTGHKDEMMSLPVSSLEDPLSITNDMRRNVYFEDKAVQLELRSLWILKLSGISYGRAFIEYGQTFRLCHMTSRMYLGVVNKQLVMVDNKDATREYTSFCFVSKGSPLPTISYLRDGMCKPTIKLGETEVSLYHVHSRLWVCLEMMGPSLRRLRTGFAGPPRARVSETRTQNSSFRVLKAMQIALSSVVCNELETALLTYSGTISEAEGSVKSVDESVEEKSLNKLNDTTVFLEPPNKKKMDMHNYQDQLLKLRNRQTRLQNHGTVNMTFALLKKAVVHYGSDATANGLKIQIALCRILCLLVKGNRLACRRFANVECIEDIIELINNPKILHPMLKLMQCLLEESPVVLMSLTEDHIRNIFTLLYHHGRDYKVMNLLGRLPVCQGVAIREKQELMCELLTESNDLLLHSSLVPKTYCMYANVFLSTNDDVEHFKWYFELQTKRADGKPYIRVGVAQYWTFLPYPRCKGSGTTEGAIGDDAYSVAFDGECVWINGEKYNKHFPSIIEQKGQDEDLIVYGCCFDLLKGAVMFTLNGALVPIQVDFDVDENSVIVPAVSFTGGVMNSRLCFGPSYGDLYYEPPDGYKPLSHFIDGGKGNSNVNICLCPFSTVGDYNTKILTGPAEFIDAVPYDPVVTDLTDVIIPVQLDKLIDGLAIELHTNWTIANIESACDDSIQSPFSQLPDDVQHHKRQEARDIVATLISLGCSISDNQTNVPSHKELPEEPYRQGNGYKPCPLVLPTALPKILRPLVILMSVIEHDKWSSGRLREGWKFGLTTRPQVKADHSLVPYQCLPVERKEAYWSKMSEVLLTILGLGYSIESPSIDLLKEDQVFTQIPYKNFRGQFVKYCSKERKWYYKVKLLKGKTSLIGWATVGCSSSSLLGRDTYSYAIDGIHGVKWHNNKSEPFGHVWQEGDVITCLLDLENRRMSFACNDEFLQCSSGDLFAFRDLPCDQMFVPAVSVYMGEQVHMILSSVEDEIGGRGGNPSSFITAGYEAIEDNMKVRIPFWYSDKSNQFKEINPHSKLIVTQPSNDVIKVDCKDVQSACLRLNMGVNVTLDKRRKKKEDQLQAIMEEEEEEEDGEEKYSFSLIIPAGDLPSLVYFGWATEDFAYNPKQFHDKSEDIILGTSPVVKTLPGEPTPAAELHSSQMSLEDAPVITTNTGDERRGRLKRRAIPEMNKIRNHRRLMRSSTINNPLIIRTGEDSEEGETNEQLISRSVSLTVTSGEPCDWEQRDRGSGLGGVEEEEGMEHYLRINKSSGYLLRMSALLGVEGPSFLSVNTQIDCVIVPSTGVMRFSCPTYSVDATFEIRARTPGKLYPILVSKSHFLKIGSFSFAPVEGCKPLIEALAGEVYNESFPNLLPSMKVLSANVCTRWYQMDDRSVLCPLESSGLSVPCLASYKTIYLSLPQEGSVMKQNELIEDSSLYSFQVETLKTFRACCMHDNAKVAQKVSKIIGWEELMHSIESSYWSYQLVSESCNLLNTLLLEHKVVECQFIREELIFPSDCLEFFNKARPQSSLTHGISTSYEAEGSVLTPNQYRQLKELMSVVFIVMNKIIATDVMKCRMLTTKYRNCLVIPLLKAVDCFLVLGIMDEERDTKRLLSLLHSSLYSEYTASKEVGLLTMSINDPQIKSVLCDILDHLCDVQLQERIKHVVRFARDYVKELQEDQRKRSLADATNQFLLQEINSPTEKQVASLLSFSSESCLTDPSLRKVLQSFHNDLTSHCTKVAHEAKEGKDLMSHKKLVKLVNALPRGVNRDNEDDSSPLYKLREITVSTVFKWSKERIHDTVLAEKIYNLLYRQFNESESLSKALKKTYIVECCSGGVSVFRSAIGKIKKMLLTGFGEDEEDVFKNTLNTLSTSKLFKSHPDLLRFSGVHTLIINVMKSYFTFNESLSSTFSPNPFSSQNTGYTGMRQNLRLSAIEEGFAGTIEDSCKFLCSFAQTSPHNQCALYEHLPYLLDQCLIHIDRVACNGTNPLDVAIATINNNLQLVLSLSAEDTLDKVIQLMFKMMKHERVGGGTEEVKYKIGSQMSMLSEFTPTEWLPAGAEKCLKFLQAAVCVNGKTVGHNASTITRLMIQQPRCLGPCYNNRSLSLLEMVPACLSLINATPSSPRKKTLTRANSKLVDTVVRLPSEAELPLSTLSTSSSSHRQRLMHRLSVLKLFYKQLDPLTSELTLSFYTQLIRVLGLCVPSSNQADSSHRSVTFLYSTDHILPFLRTLISLEDLIELLSHPMDSLHPYHKEALLVFLERVYSTEDHVLFLDLIKLVFIPDIKIALKLAREKSKSDSFIYMRYITQHALPYMERQSSCIVQLVSELPLLLDLTDHVYQLIELASDLHRIKIQEYLITVTKALPPQGILKLLPRIIDDLRQEDTPSFMVAVKIITAHYQTHSQYYVSGWITGPYDLEPPSRHEVAYISFLFSIVCMLLFKETIKSSVPALSQCLEGLHSAISPRSLTPTFSELRKVGVETRSISFSSCLVTLEDGSIDSHIVDDGTSTCINEMTLSDEWEERVLDYVKYCHECWVYERQQLEGWTYGSVSSEDDYRDSRLIPFEYISDKMREKMLRCVRLIVKTLLYYGCSFTSDNDKLVVVLKPRYLCLNTKNKESLVQVLSPSPNSNRWHLYEPLVTDLEPVNMSLHYDVIIDSAIIILSHLDPKGFVKPAAGERHIRESGLAAYDPIKYLYFDKTERGARGIITDFLKYFKIQGVLAHGPFAPLPGSLQCMLTQHYDHEILFSKQLFGGFTEFLLSKCKCEALETCQCRQRKQELFPLIGSYITSHALYFDPCSRGKLPHSSYYSEIVLILKLLCEVHFHAQDFFISAPSTTSTRRRASSIPWMAELQLLKEKNLKLINQFSTLSLSLIKAIDMRDSGVLMETEQFFSFVDATVKLLPEAMGRVLANGSNLSDMKLLLYVSECLVPSLTVLVRCTEYVKEYPKNCKLISLLFSIFGNLYTSVHDNTEVFLESKALTSFGQCLSSLCMAQSVATISSSPFFKSAMYSLKRVAIFKVSSQQMSFITLVVAPILTSYAVNQGKQGDSSEVDKILRLILRIVSKYQDCSNATWMKELCCSSCQLAAHCSMLVYKTHFIPLLKTLSDRGERLWKEEQLLSSSLHIKESELLVRHKKFDEGLKLYGQDLVSFLLFLVILTDNNKEAVVDSQQKTLLRHITLMVSYSFRSQRFTIVLNSWSKNYVQNIRGIELKNWNILMLYTMNLIKYMPKNVYNLLEELSVHFDQPGKLSTDFDQYITNLLTQDPIEQFCLRTWGSYWKRISPSLISYEFFANEKETERRAAIMKLKTYTNDVCTIKCLSHVLSVMKQGAAPSTSVVARGRWRDAMTRSKREAIINCLKAIPFHKLKKRHRAMNLFIQEYTSSWLIGCQPSNMKRLCDQFLNDKNDSNKDEVDSLEQLFSFLEMQASTGQWLGNSGVLYDCYATTLIKTFQSIIDDAVKMQESVYDKFQSGMYEVTVKQEQLISRRIPEMIVAVIASSNGKLCHLLHITLKLAIVLLDGGNPIAQKRLLEKLKSAGDEFWISLSHLISSFVTLDWGCYEKCQVITDHTNIVQRVFPVSNEAITLFRFLQLLCEGHNEGFQNFLRVQSHNVTSINIVTTTVDYLLQVQCSIKDLYWHHSCDDSFELPARETLLAFFKVAKQILRTLTEFVQGPCVGNQETLALSRLWDAMGGFLHIFNPLQQKLIRHSSHMELLLELLQLQEEFFILLRGMIEGSIGANDVSREMLNMFREDIDHVKDLITFYHVFIKLKDMSSSKAFREYDLNKDGLISFGEFEQAMKAQQDYTTSEINYLMDLADTNRDGLLDYQEFTERFYQPTHTLGFHLCALLRQLFDIQPDNPTLVKINEHCLDLYKDFEDNMGCIEMRGKSCNIERVYFYIKSSHALQWNDQSIKESREKFLNNVNWSNQNDKLEDFVDFCEDTIYQMAYNDETFGVEQGEREKRADERRNTQYPETAQQLKFFDRIHTKLLSMRINNPKNIFLLSQSALSFIWLTLILGIILAPIFKTLQGMRTLTEYYIFDAQGSLKYSSSHLLFVRRFLIRYFIPDWYMPRTVYSLKSVRALFASSYYIIKYSLTITTLIINVIILVTIRANSYHENNSVADDHEQAFLDALDYFIYIHFGLSCVSIISFWHLKVPLIIFRKEKSIARRLEKHNGTLNKRCFSHFDCIVVKSPSFPRRFWDKQVKERVLDRCSAEERSALAESFGVIENEKPKLNEISRKEKISNAIASVIDIRYQIWSLIMISFDLTFLYHVVYCLISLAAIKYNIFLFSFHLLELTLQSKTLNIVLRSLRLNLKQVIMTLVVTVVMVFVYSAIAFSWFGKYYLQDMAGGHVKDHCESVLSCFLFHLDHGLRSGGGIADVILSASGDELYVARLIFDLTFFFLIVIILLAVFQGLIIDAFSELRKKDDGVTEDLRNKCFICGLTKSDFGNPHQFDAHIGRHHSLRDYMFFLLHLITKPETEFTGQESLFWKLYLKQSWDLFPAGTCFQMQDMRRRAQHGHSL